MINLLLEITVLPALFGMATAGVLIVADKLIEAINNLPIQ